MATRPNYRDEAFVIRSYKLGEADLILVLLTKDHGVVRAVAAGIRKTNSRFGAHLDRFSRVSVQIYPGRKDLGKITDATIVAYYASPIIADVDSYYAASAVLELALALSHEPDVAAQLFPLVDDVLGILAGSNTQAATPDLPAMSQTDRFLLSALGVAGWAPSLVSCAQCGRTGPHVAFNAAAGGAVCVHCRPPRSLTPPPQAVRFLWLLQHNRLDTAAGILEQDGSTALARIAHDLLLAHARHQLEVGLPAYSAL